MSPTGADTYREWAGAHILGALGPSERREFDKHLEVCADCAAYIAQRSGLPAKLSLLSRGQARAPGQRRESDPPRRDRNPGQEVPTASEPAETPSSTDHHDG